MNSSVPFDSGDATGTTSVLTMHEVLTNSANVTLHPIDLSLCGIAAGLRAKYAWLRAPDALQIGTAIGLGAPIIVTNDQRWSRVTEVEVALLRNFI